MKCPAFVHSLIPLPTFITGTSLLDFSIWQNPPTPSRSSLNSTWVAVAALFLLFHTPSLLSFKLPQWLRQYRICLQCRRLGLNSWVRKIPWRREWLTTLVFLPGAFRGQRSLASYSSWGHRMDTTKQLTLASCPSACRVGTPSLKALSNVCWVLWNETWTDVSTTGDIQGQMKADDISLFQSGKSPVCSRWMLNQQMGLYFTLLFSFLWKYTGKLPGYTPDRGHTTSPP